MEKHLESIEIKNLFGHNSYKILFAENKLIIVAENGLGKTTIVNIIYYFLSKQWTKLLKYDFTSITAHIGGKELILKKDEIDLGENEKFKRLFRRYPHGIKERFENILLSIDFNEFLRNPSKIEYYADNFNLPPSLLYEISMLAEREQQNLFTSTLIEKNKLLDAIFDAQILYLPTYRRIEQDLKNIFPDLEIDVDRYRKRRIITTRDQDNFVELVEFGMEDVENKIHTRLKTIKDNFNNKLKNELTGLYLRDIINKNYLKTEYDIFKTINEDTISIILSRIGEAVLSDNEKETLKNYVKEINKLGAIERVENQIIAHFIFRLSSTYLELQKDERDVVEFIQLVNQYLTNKKIIYDNINFDLYILPIDKKQLKLDEAISLRDLSSGEKQIISLFSHIYFSKKKKYFIIIDEPELSLSVNWQQKLLPDILKSNYCYGMLAVTHSPFIFDNELKTYTHSLNEYQVGN